MDRLLFVIVVLSCLYVTEVVSAEGHASVIVCEGASAYLKCACSKGIKILDVNYGRTEGGHICPSKSIKTTRCRSSKSSRNLIRKKCDGQSLCKVTASNSVFGDPCGGTYKYLYVKFVCK